MATKLLDLMGSYGDSGRHYRKGPVLHVSAACGLACVPYFQRTGPQAPGTFSG